MPLPLRFAVSPGDRYRLQWSNDIAGFVQGAYLPYQPDPTEPTHWYYPLGTSYRYPVAFTCPDARTVSRGTVVSAGTYWQYTYSGSLAWDSRHLSEVAFPSQKVMLCDSAQWQGARRPVYGLYPFARVPTLLVDGSASVRVTGQSSFQPGNPRSPFPAQMTYDPLGSAPPRSWDPPILGPVVPTMTGYHIWTRGGLTGRDFNGQEVDTGTQ